MAEGVNVRLTGKMRSFIESRISDDGLYHSTSEYIRDLVRRDYEQSEAQKWNRLMETLQPGIQAPESDFVSFDAEDIINEARKNKR